MAAYAGEVVRLHLDGGQWAFDSSGCSIVKDQRGNQFPLAKLYEEIALTVAVVAVTLPYVVHAVLFDVLMIIQAATAVRCARLLAFEAPHSEAVRP